MKTNENEFSNYSLFIFFVKNYNLFICKTYQELISKTNKRVRRSSTSWRIKEYPGYPKWKRKFGKSKSNLCSSHSSLCFKWHYLRLVTLSKMLDVDFTLNRPNEFTKPTSLVILINQSNILKKKHKEFVKQIKNIMMCSMEKYLK